jgi:hypothetical protein
MIPTLLRLRTPSSRHSMKYLPSGWA